ncbi:MAG: hypothetical protein MR670_10790 [Prevotella sp.]|nr:hypothetical protein [Prevotella sp.]
MKNRLIITICVAAAVVMTACSSNDAQKSAEGMLEKAEKYFSEGSYDRAKIAIDSLRKVYPGAVETRKKALKLFQDISLKEAQEDLALTDSIMQKVGLDYKYIKEKVEKDKAELRATAEELELLTRTKMKYDSLKVRFDMQCAKIKYIHKKQKE